MAEISLNKLKENIFNQAEVYLVNLGNFAPFGATTANGIIQPVGYYEDVDIVDSKKSS